MHQKGSVIFWLNVKKFGWKYRIFTKGLNFDIYENCTIMLQNLFW
jgi:hypothetical protein